MDVFIVENSSSVRASMHPVLSDISEVKVVGRAVCETSAIERIAALLPDVVILDLNLQSGSGFGVLETVKKCHSTIKVIVFSHYIDQLCIDRCKRAGADYFFDKSFQLMQLREILWKWAHTDRLDNKFRPGSLFEASRPDDGCAIDVM
jgi:DNA-binding NarL/FixJ family response regulator